MCADKWFVRIAGLRIILGAVEVCKFPDCLLCFIFINIVGLAATDSNGDAIVIVTTIITIAGTTAVSVTSIV